MRYAYRILAIVTLLAWAIWVTSLIGRISDGTPMTWGGAWGVTFMFATAMWLGFQAGCESKETPHDH